MGGGTNISQTKNVRENDGSEPPFSCFNQMLQESAPQDVEGGTNISQAKNVRGNNSPEALFVVSSQFVKNWNAFRFRKGCAATSPRRNTCATTIVLKHFLLPLASVGQELECVQIP